MLSNCRWRRAAGGGGGTGEEGTVIFGQVFFSLVVCKEVKNGVRDRRRGEPSYLRGSFRAGGEIWSNSKTGSGSSSSTCVQGSFGALIGGFYMGGGGGRWLRVVEWLS